MRVCVLYEIIVDAEGDILENVVYSNDCAMMESGRRVGK